MRHVRAKPKVAANRPPISIQTELLVGDPVKNLDTSELKEFMALIPTIMSATPPTSTAMETSLFRAAFQ